MSLSYGEVAAVEAAWDEWKAAGHGSDASSAWEFIASECDMYSEEEQDEIFTEIGCLEER